MKNIVRITTVALVATVGFGFAGASSASAAGISPITRNVVGPQHIPTIPCGVHRRGSKPCVTVPSGPFGLHPVRPGFPAPQPR